MRAAGGIFSAPRPVSTTPLTTGRPQLNLAEDGIRRDATYSPRTKMERSVPSCGENSARRHVGRIPLARPSGRAGAAVAPSAARAACSSTAGLHGQHEWRGHSSRCWSKRALSPRASRACVHPTCAPAPSASTTNRPGPQTPSSRRCRAVRRSPSVPPRAARPCPGTHLPIGLFYQRSPSCGTEPARPAHSSAPRPGKARVRVNGRWRSCRAPLLPSCRLLRAGTAAGPKVTPGRCSWGSLRRPGSVSGYIWKFMRSYHNTGNSK